MARRRRSALGPPRREDRGFVLAAIAAGLRVVRAHDAAVRWPPTTTWGGNMRRFHRYARGDMRLPSRARHGLRAAAWLVAPAAALRGGAGTRAACAVLGLSYLGLPIQRARAVGLPAAEWCWRCRWRSSSRISPRSAAPSPAYSTPPARSGEPAGADDTLDMLAR